jgi:hypothetical protein
MAPPGEPLSAAGPAMRSDHLVVPVLRVQVSGDVVMTDPKNVYPRSTTGV